MSLHAANGDRLVYSDFNVDWGQVLRHLMQAGRGSGKQTGDVLIQLGTSHLTTCTSCTMGQLLLKIWTSGISSWFLYLYDF